jgi:hypothetical protein
MTATGPGTHPGPMHGTSPPDTASGGLSRTLVR